jgi:hypothetical protein
LILEEDFGETYFYVGGIYRIYILIFVEKDVFAEPVEYFISDDGRE